MGNRIQAGCWNGRYAREDMEIVFVDFGSSIKRVTFSTADLAKHAELVSFEMEDGFWHPPPAEDADSDE